MIKPQKTFAVLFAFTASLYAANLQVVSPLPGVGTANWGDNGTWGLLANNLKYPGAIHTQIFSTNASWSVGIGPTNTITIQPTLLQWRLVGRSSDL